jgi:hypothetical protein
MKHDSRETLLKRRSARHVSEITAIASEFGNSVRCLYLLRHSREQFLHIAVKVCSKLSEETALIIAEETWGDIRDVISLSKLVKKYDGPDEIAEIIKTLAKYGGERVGT